MSKVALASAYLRTRALAVTQRDRAKIKVRQARRIEQLRRHAMTRTAFYRDLGDVPFASWPVVDKATVMARFEAFNTLGLSAAQLWPMVERGEAPPGYDVGCSTGTSGNRGLYLVSDAERFTWLGTIVAKALPDVWRRRHRVAIVLPRTSRLYASANESRLLTLLFLDVGRGLATLAEQLTAFGPTVIVAPPKVLRYLADAGVRIAPERIFSAAEVLDPPDRTRIEAAYGVRLGQIYMATEGLFGVSCGHGTLHLAEDCAHFELDSVGNGLVSPIVTDFTRRTQVMARYRMNDLLRLHAEPCACGSPLQAVAEIIGRRDDVFDLLASDGSGRRVLVTPDVLRNAVLDADRGIDDFRVRQVGEQAIELVLSPLLTDTTCEAARRAIARACAAAGATVVVDLRREPLSADGVAKLRRVERCWRPAL